MLRRAGKWAPTVRGRRATPAAVRGHWPAPLLMLGEDATTALKARRAGECRKMTAERRPWGMETGTFAGLRGSHSGSGASTSCLGLLPA